MSKHQEIRRHLKAGEPITGLTALKLYGVYRLSSIINRLRTEGLAIKTVMVKADNGQDVFAKYFIPINERLKK